MGNLVPDMLSQPETYKGIPGSALTQRLGPFHGYITRDSTLV